MEPQGIFNQTMSVLEKALDLRSVKHNSIVSNIANMDTPNYKAFDFVVEEELDKLMRSENGIELRRTQPGHFSGNGDHLDNNKIEIDSRREMTARADGNSVNIDKEMANLAENNLMYNALAEIMSKKCQGLKEAIKEGK